MSYPRCLVTVSASITNPMTLDELKAQLAQKQRALQDYIDNDLKDEMGIIAVEHYKDSFRNQGFTDSHLEKWQEVKRRVPGNPWYGHSGQTGRVSLERTTAPILHGETRELSQATRYIKTARGVRILNEKPYARVHNEGLPAKVYGKTPFTMPRRQFFGPSRMMVSKIKSAIKDSFKRILTT